MKLPEANKLAFMALGIVAGTITFFVVTQLTVTLSRSLLLALGMGAWAGVFVFNYVPVHFLARVKPTTLHPPAHPYRIRPIDALAEIKSALSQEYFAGKSWVEKTQDRDRKELLFVCRYQDMDVSDKGASVVDAEIQLTANVQSVDGKAVVQLDYRMSDPRPSTVANEICKATSSYIQAALMHFEERELCRTQA